MDEVIYIAHHGIKGQKWGVRRFQNADGSLTDAGKKRYSTGETNSKSGSGISKETVKKVAAAAAVIGTVSAATYIYSKNPTVCQNVVKTIGSVTTRSLNSAGKKLVDSGKQYLKVAAQQAKEGAKEGLVNAPKKVAKAAVEGAAIIAANKMLNALIGEQNAADYKQAYNAYNKKNKIGALPNRNKYEDDEDD